MIIGNNRHSILNGEYSIRLGKGQIGGGDVNKDVINSVEELLDLLAKVFGLDCSKIENVRTASQHFLDLGIH